MKAIFEKALFGAALTAVPGLALAHHGESEELVGRCEALHLDTDRLDQPFQRVAHGLVVVDDKHGSFGWSGIRHDHEAALTAASTLGGNSMMKVLPLPGALSTLMVPWWSSTNRLTRARPRPVPPKARVDV